MNEKKKTIIMRVLVIVAMLAIVGACVYMYLRFGKSAIELIKDTDRFKAWIDGFGVWGIIVFVAIRVLQTVVKFIPTEPIEIVAGLVWGWFGGLMLCLLGNILGSIIILIMTRRIGTRILRLFRLEKKLQSMRFLQDREKRNRILFIFYLVPGTPKDSMTYFAGLTDMNMTEFMIISSIARIPAIVSSTICGAYLGANNFEVAAIVFVVTALLSIPGGILYKKISARYMQNHQETGSGSEPEGESEPEPEPEKSEQQN
ncbi:MAG: VTT domain-containing protein [Clostridia bacterium]|nr:VTT domain-containing protein [Clostridia bacterium]